MKTKIAKYHLTALFLLISLFSYTQKKQGFIPPSIDDEEIPVAKTELPVPEEGKDYVVKYFKGITDGVESRIAVKNLGYIIRPAMVQVISEDGRELAIELVKKNWDDIVRSDITKAGIYESSFKTALEFGIKISAKEMGIPFVVVISAGKELFPASNLFVDASTMRSGNGNKEMSITDEADLMNQESGQSNSTLFIIIAIALVGILGLLAVLVFKKKGKGSTTLLLLLATLAINAGEVKEIRPELPNEKIEDPGDHYHNRKPSDDDPLDEDDNDHMPNPNPPGQPSLPTSCIETAQNNGPRSSDDGQGSPITKDPTNSGGGTNMPTGIGGSETEEDVADEDGKDKDYAKERQKIQNDFQNYRDLALGRMEQGKMEAQENFNRSSREASKQFEKDVQEANGNVELIAQAAANHANTVAQLSVELSSASTQFDIEYAMDLADLAEDLAYEFSVLAEEEAANNQQQQNSDGGGGEKDPDREPKKDPDREDEHQSKGNPPSDESQGPGKRENPDNQKKACQCLDAAYADLREQQERLENLLIIGQHTKKVTDFGIAFGDNVAGIHTVSGLTWQTQKLKVVQSMNQFNDTYTKKYNEIIAELYQVMMQINSCEDKLGVKNWYAKWGFIYYEFMKARYASYK